MIRDAELRLDGVEGAAHGIGRTLDTMSQTSKPSLMSSSVASTRMAFHRNRRQPAARGEEPPPIGRPCTPRRRRGSCARATAGLPSLPRCSRPSSARCAARRRSSWDGSRGATAAVAPACRPARAGLGMPALRMMLCPPRITRSRCVPADTKHRSPARMSPRFSTSGCSPTLPRLALLGAGILHRVRREVALLCLQGFHVRR